MRVVVKHLLGARQEAEAGAVDPVAQGVVEDHLGGIVGVLDKEGVVVGVEVLLQGDDVVGLEQGADLDHPSRSVVAGNRGWEAVDVVGQNPQLARWQRILRSRAGRDAQRRATKNTHRCCSGEGMPHSGCSLAGLDSAVLLEP